MTPHERQVWIEREACPPPPGAHVAHGAPIMDSPDARGRQCVALLLAMRLDIPAHLGLALLAAAPLHLDGPAAVAWVGAIPNPDTAETLQ